MVHADGTFNLVAYVVDNPRYLISVDGFFAVDLENYTKCLDLGGVKIDFLLWKAVNVSIIYLDHEGVFGLGQVFDQNFREGM